MLFTRLTLSNIFLLSSTVHFLASPREARPQSPVLLLARVALGVGLVLLLLVINKTLGIQTVHLLPLFIGLTQSQL